MCLGEKVEQVSRLSLQSIGEPRERQTTGESSVNVCVLHVCELL